LQTPVLGVLSFQFQPRNPIWERSNDNQIGRRAFISVLGGTPLGWLHTTSAWLCAFGFLGTVAVKHRLTAFDLGAVLVGCRNCFLHSPLEFAPVFGHLRDGGS